VALAEGEEDDATANLLTLLPTCDGGVLKAEAAENEVSATISHA